MGGNGGMCCEWIRNSSNKLKCVFWCTYWCVLRCNARVGGVCARGVFLFVSECFCFVSKYSNRCADHQMWITEKSEVEIRCQADLKGFPF